MKKLILLFIGMFLFFSCEKEEIKLIELDGIYESNIFKLADFDLVKINLRINEGIIEGMFLTPINSKYKYVFRVDSIFENTMIYFHFYGIYIDEYDKCVWTGIYNGTFDITENSSINYLLIGNLKVKKIRLNTYRWKKSFLYFK